MPGLAVLCVQSTCRPTQPLRQPIISRFELRTSLFRALAHSYLRLSHLSPVYSAGAFPIDNRQISSLHCGQQPPLESPLHLQYYLTRYAEPQTTLLRPGLTPYTARMLLYSTDSSQSRLIRDCQRECTLPPQDLAKYNGPWGISIRIKSDRDLSAIIAYCARVL